MAAERGRGLLPPLNVVRAARALAEAGIRASLIPSNHGEQNVLDYAGILVVEDQPATVDRTVAAFVKRSGGE